MKNIIRNYISLILLTITIITHAQTQWQKLAPGLEYTRLQSINDFSGSAIHAFRIDLNHFQLQSQTTYSSRSLQSIQQIVLANHAVIGVNGGFFTPDFKPIGLRINDGKMQNPLHTTKWWGVFYIENSAAHIVALNNFKMNKDIHFAVQAGPRLIINNIIPPLKPKFDNRTALGITKDNKVILVATEDLPITTTELARIMKAPAVENGLECIDALNLDGGSSTQLYAKLPNFELNIPNFATVADVVLVIPKKMPL